MKIAILGSFAETGPLAGQVVWMAASRSFGTRDLAFRVLRR